MKTNSLEKPESTLLKIWNILSGSPLGKRLRAGHCRLSQRWPFNLGWHTELLKSMNPNILTKVLSEECTIFPVGEICKLPNILSFQSKKKPWLDFIPLHDLAHSWFPAKLWICIPSMTTSGGPALPLPVPTPPPPLNSEELTFYPAARYHGWGSVLMTLIVSFQMRQAWCGWAW